MVNIVLMVVCSVILCVHRPYERMVAVQKRPFFDYRFAKVQPFCKSRKFSLHFC